MRVRIVLSRGQEIVREQTLQPGLFVIGRDPSCDIAIDDVAVSKQHLRLELSDDGVIAEDLGSRNGLRVNGLPAQRQALRHLDVIQIGNHRMHIFDDAFLPEGAIDPESTVNGHDARGAAASPLGGLDDTQPGTNQLPPGPVFGLERLDQDVPELSMLDQARTVVGAPGKAALLVRRRDKMVLTKLSRSPLNVNGREVEGTALAVDEGDVIDVGSLRYRLVRLT
jgi:predicted component of type VI protein secretion system